MIPEKYKGIIDLPYHGSETRPKMDRVNRAAQFSPFAALVGYYEILGETDRQTVLQEDFGEDDRTELDRKLTLLIEKEKQRPLITVTYFVPDEKKEGGRYVTETKNIKRVDTTLRKMIFTDKTELPLDLIVSFAEKEETDAPD